MPIRDFSAKYAVMQSSMTAAERIFALLDEDGEPMPATPRVPEAVRGAIEFDHVWFAYKTTDGREPDWVLRDVSFRIAPGDRVAVVGATSSGKTTLIKLLDRLYHTLQKGASSSTTSTYASGSGAALPQPNAFILRMFSSAASSPTTTLRVGHRPSPRRRAAVAMCTPTNSSRAWADRDAQLRERGSNLSTGQRQLLAFARALAHDPAVLVMDEATSSVDPETEWLVQDALERLLAGRTALIIAHRLSTIEHADRILVVHKGQLREEGTHAELLARDGIYARLYRVQYAPGRPEAAVAAAGRHG